ncbi:hypothetical protein PHYSODRAFT_298738 [Phytophthora sojae]|uniref:Uncharacterized protein n=1 Tax=Phytophthora sojae (strain P6497) TaxID=1094619 RepID=G4Z372_PHYSP|nr:hypothetical protein PHYSODRAFT_298738 [Phytophthora sojae]EGZ20741.1 hypothetical protein PHYSODRAFT_298738 [Phytophthora sojae]|eukprot:XP_009523458.1 hypothetical protein PHYSODRAFT_298738 [Phytophthora sojae]
MWAAQNGRLGIVYCLVERCGIDVNDRNNDGNTARIEAVYYVHKDIAQFITKQCGADVNVKNSSGYTALMWAATYGRVDVVECLAGECGADAQESYWWNYCVDAGSSK